MFSIQIDTKGLTTSNSPSLQAIWNRVFNYVRLIDAVRLLDSRCSRVRQRLPDFAEFEFQTPEWNKRRVNQSLEDFIMFVFCLFLRTRIILWPLNRMIPLSYKVIDQFWSLSTSCGELGTGLAIEQYRLFPQGVAFISYFLSWLFTAMPAVSAYAVVQSSVRKACLYSDITPNWEISPIRRNAVPG